MFISMQPQNFTGICLVVSWCFKPSNFDYMKSSDLLNKCYVYKCYVFVVCTNKTMQFTLHPHTSFKGFHALLCMIVHFLILSHLYDVWIVIVVTAVCGLLNLASCFIFEQLASGDKYNKSLLLFK